MQLIRPTTTRQLLPFLILADCSSSVKVLNDFVWARMHAVAWNSSSAPNSTWKERKRKEVSRVGHDAGLVPSFYREIRWTAFTMRCGYTNGRSRKLVWSRSKNVPRAIANAKCHLNIKSSVIRPVEALFRHDW